MFKGFPVGAEWACGPHSIFRAQWLGCHPWHGVVARPSAVNHRAAESLSADFLRPTPREAAGRQLLLLRAGAHPSSWGKLTDTNGNVMLGAG